MRAAENYAVEQIASGSREHGDHESEGFPSSRQSSRRRRWLSILRAVGVSLTWLLIGCGVVFAATAAWILRTFGQVSIPQLVMNLPRGTQGDGGGADPALVESFILECLVLPASGTLLVALIYFLVRRFTRRSRGQHAPVPRARWWRAVIAGATALSILFGGGWYLAQSVQLRQYIEGISGSVSMEPYYREPFLLSTPASAKNLVIIYLESMDDAFGDEDLVGEDLLIAVKKSTDDWAKLEALRQYPAAGWTMAGLIGTQCGIPPRPAGGVWATEVLDANLIGDGEDAYLPGAICLGDILAENGYHNVFLGGASADFASKGSFLNTHGYETVLDRKYWEANGESEFSGWGLSDRRLFENAKDELAKLHAGDRPFNLTMLTLDNHVPVHDFGYCPQTSETPTHAAIRCQSELTADLIEFMRESGMLEDTVVVIMADHLMMPSEATEYREGVEPRIAAQTPLFARFWSPDGIDFARADAHQLHLYPTMLELLDFEIDNYQAGLGVSLLVDPVWVDASTFLDGDIDELRAVLASPSQNLYDRLWGVIGES